MTETVKGHRGRPPLRTSAGSVVGHRGGTAAAEGAAPAGIVACIEAVLALVAEGTGR